MGKGQEASEGGDGITGVSSAPATHNERGLVSFDNKFKEKAKNKPKPLQ